MLVAVGVVTYVACANGVSACNPVFAKVSPTCDLGLKRFADIALQLDNSYSREQKTFPFFYVLLLRSHLSKYGTFFVVRYVLKYGGERSTECSSDFVVSVSLACRFVALLLA